MATPAGEALVQRAQQEGHRIGSHTWSHVRLGPLSSGAAVTQFNRGVEAIAELGIPERLFRPVGGGIIGPHLLHPAVVDRMVREGFTCVLWNSVPRDWKEPDGWLERGLADLEKREWSLVVLHDVPCIAHLDEYLRRAREAGHTFVEGYPEDCLPIVEGHVMGLSGLQSGGY